MSDWWAQHTGAASALAGLDMTMAGDQNLASGNTWCGSNLTAAVLNGTVPQWRLDDMAVRIMSAFYKGVYIISINEFASLTPPKSAETRSEYQRTSIRGARIPSATNTPWPRKATARSTGTSMFKETTSISFERLVVNPRFS